MPRLSTEELVPRLRKYIRKYDYLSRNIDREKISWDRQMVIDCLDASELIVELTQTGRIDDMKSPILTDKRQIVAIYWDDGESSQLGENGVTDIVAYGEVGPYTIVPWIAIYEEDELSVRVPASHLTIQYERTKEDPTGLKHDNASPKS